MPTSIHDEVRIKIAEGEDHSGVVAEVVETTVDPYAKFVERSITLPRTATFDMIKATWALFHQLAAPIFLHVVIK